MRRVFPLLLLLALLLAGCQGEAAPAVSYDLDQVPAYAGEPYVVINDNQPFFGEEEYTTEAFETYSALDGLGRCGTAYACVGEELMPAGERESISSVKPSGWINVEYGGQYLYNRCHLIGFQLTGENANERNLITGTRYMNVEGMLPFENLVADYVKETSNHVLYRVTPLYEGDNLVASGVLMEAGSVEDEREGICFNVYVYNVQPHRHRLRHRRELGGRGTGGDPVQPNPRRYRLRAEYQHEEIPPAHLRQRGGHEAGEPDGLHRKPGGPAGRGLFPLRPVQAVKQNRRGASLRGGFSASQQEEQGQKQGAGQDGEEDVHRPQAQGLAARAGDAAVEAPGLHGDGQLLRPAHRLDQQGLEQGGGDGKNPDTAGGKGGAGALVLLHHIGQDAPGGQQAVGEHRGEAELLLEGAH